MAFFEWSNTFSVGVMEMDAQHRRLVDIVNRLHDAMKNGAAKTSVMCVVEELVAYTRTHFASEERVMRAAGYPEIDEHIAVHRKLIAHVESFRAETGASLPLKLMSFLKGWLTKHILETDKKYAPYVTKAKVA